MPGLALCKLLRCELDGTAGVWPPQTYVDAVALDLISGGKLTKLGKDAAVAMREYLRWLDGDTTKGIKPKHVASPLDDWMIEGKRIIDLGCGTFRQGFDCLARGAASVTGIDAQEHAQLFARVIARREGLLVPAILKNPIEDTGFGPDNFDTALCRITLQYTTVKAALKEINRILKPDGLLVLRCVTHAECWRLLGRALRGRDLHGVRDYGLALLNTACLQWLGFQFRLPGRMLGGWSVTYPTERWLHRELLMAGFLSAVEPSPDGPRIVAHKF